MKNGLPFSILIVEDDEDDRMIIDQAFQEIGYEAEVKKFMDAKALFHYLEQIDPSLYPSLIVLDNSLPGLDAQEVLLRLKKDRRYQKLPVVIYTGLVSGSGKEQLLGLGAHDVIEKGYTMNKIIEIAKRLKNLAGNPGKHS